MTTLAVNGRTRTYTLVAPPELRPDATLFLVFHGSNQTGRQVRAASGFDALTAGGRGVVAYLDGHRKHWNDPRRATTFGTEDDVAFTEAVVDEVTARTGTSRTFPIGYSNGGQFVIRLVHEIPHRLAGAALISAAQPVPEEFAPARDAGLPLPVLLVHGTGDRLVPYSGGMASLWGFRPRGLGLSAPETAAYYAARNGITAAPTTTPLPHRGGRTTVVRTDYREDGRPPVTLYTVEGGGHVIPGPGKAPRILGRNTPDLVTAEAVTEFLAAASVS